jgi:hypothetical protein
MQGTGTGTAAQGTGTQGTGTQGTGTAARNQNMQNQDQAAGAQDDLERRPRRPASGEPRATADERRDDPTAPTPPRAQDENTP